MNNSEFTIFLVLYYLSLVHCAPHKRNMKEKTIRKYKSRTGEPIAVDDLIQTWEHEHQKLHKEEANMNNDIEWNDLKNTNVNEYCRKYLHQCVPGRMTYDAFGFKQFITLHYAVQNTGIGGFVEILTCKTQKTGTLFHITRAPESNCVYAVSRKNGGFMSRSNIYSIINKHCGFENDDYIEVLKWKKEKMKKISHFHKSTGQPIAIEELLRQYELEHQKLHQMEDAHINWPQVTTHKNINEYCSKYIKKFIPNRNHNNMRASLKQGKIKYYKENVGRFSSAVILRCAYSNSVFNRGYYLTRALEPNCVYAILRCEGKLKTVPFQIIYKHCDFEHPNFKFENLKDSDTTNL